MEFPRNSAPLLVLRLDSPQRQLARVLFCRLAFGDVPHDLGKKDNRPLTVPYRCRNNTGPEWCPALSNPQALAFIFPSGFRLRQLPEGLLPIPGRVKDRDMLSNHFLAGIAKNLPRAFIG